MHASILQRTDQCPPPLKFCRHYAHNETRVRADKSSNSGATAENGAVYLAHKFFSREDKLVIYKPPRVIFEEAAIGMDHHSLLVLNRLVLPTFPQPGRVIEEAGSDGL